MWIGTRSYGLYSFHWPIYQAIRSVAGNTLSLVELAGALVLSATIAELSYRYVEMPIRRGTFLIDIRYRWQRPTFREDSLSSVLCGARAGRSSVRERSQRAVVGDQHHRLRLPGAHVATHAGRVRRHAR